MDSASPQPGSAVFPLSSVESQTNDTDMAILPQHPSIARLVPAVAQEMFPGAEYEACGLTLAEFGAVLSAAGARCNFNQPPGVDCDASQRAAFFRSLRLADLALANACVLGRESAWKRFLNLYRAPLTKAAIAITRSATLGEELADSLYAELYGIRQIGSKHKDDTGELRRRSPLATYSGRGSLLGWLRTILAQRHVDHHRRTHRETPIGDFDTAAPQAASAPLPAHLAYLTHALTRTLRSLNPENRFLLAAYFLDQRTLLDIGRILNVHEATVSRRIKRLSLDLRDELLRNLQIGNQQTGGLSRDAAEEALGIDPRDLEINLRWLLRTSQASSFHEESAAKSEVKSDVKNGAEGGPQAAGQPAESGQS